MDHNLLVFIFAILGNFVSCCVYIAPALSTFKQIYRKKSTLGYDSLPYVVALFSAMLWMYYAFLAKDKTLITINAVGCVIETLYIIVFLKYGTREAQKRAVKQIVSLNVCLFGFIILLTYFRFYGTLRVTIVGWVCVFFAACVFAAPLSVVVKVIRTRSVESMTFPLSCCLTVSAVVWFAYGLFKGDMNVALPNVLGFLLGVSQMLLYAIFRNSPKKVLDEEQLPEHIINMVMISGPEVHPVDLKTCETENEENKAEDKKNENEIVYYDEKSVCQSTEDPNLARVQIIANPPPLVVCAC